MPVSEASSAPESSIEIELAPPRLHGLRTLAERWAIHAGFNYLDSGKLLAAVDEALTNIHLHSYSGRPGLVRIDIHMTPEELIFELSDHGKAFDPKHGASRHPGEIGAGGWGMVMIQNGFQRIERRRVGDNNILLLARRLSGKTG
ncbi:MAG: ATP-binding protein [Verrucomicrobia bacterium]|nr:ATP-binding protein [Verrucomicrobiota bacterium]